MQQSFLTFLLSLFQKVPKSLPKKEPEKVKEPSPTVKEKAKMKLSLDGKKRILAHEGWSAKPYLDTGGVPTIGYGNTYYEDGRRVMMNDPVISKERGEQLFDIVVKKYEEGVNQLVTVPLNQNQFDALVSFAYNVGLDQDDDSIAEGLGDSTLLKLLNKGDYAGAANEFPKWCKDNGKVVSGLVRRRKEEQELFLKTV
jgi:lysozyme